MILCVNPGTEIPMPTSESGEKSVRKTKGSLEALSSILKSSQKYINCRKFVSEQAHRNPHGQHYLGITAARCRRLHAIKEMKKVHKTKTAGFY